MADNITAPATGALLATDECVINGVTVQVPRVKVSWGVDGTAIDASATNPLPVAFTGSLGVTGTFWQATQPISAAALPLPSGASTSALQTTMNTSLGLLATAAAQTAGNTALSSLDTKATANNAALGSPSDAAWDGSSANPSNSSIQKRIAALLADPTAAKVDTVVQSAAVDRGLIIGFSGIAAAATTASTTLTVTVPTSQGVPVVGQVIAGTGITAGTTITAVSGTAPNYSLTLSAVATVANAAAVTGNPGSVAFMALNANRRGWSIFNYSASAIVYVSGLGAATTDYHSLRIKPGEFYDTKDSHAGTSALTIISDTGGALVYAREW